MACEQTSITPVGPIPELGCCVGGPQVVQYDHVYVRLDTHLDQFSPNFNAANLQDVFTRCLAEPMPPFTNLNIWKPARAAETRVGGPIGPIDACYPNFGAPTIVRIQATHGGVFQLAGSFMSYYACKIRIRLVTVGGLPFFRRWCVTTCLGMLPVNNCSAGGCTQSTSTVLPASSEEELTPTQLVPVGVPFGLHREFNFTRLEFDSDPPASPFCGLP